MSRPDSKGEGSARVDVPTVAARAAEARARCERISGGCPSCGSPSPSLHPHEPGDSPLCSDAFHSRGEGSALDDFARRSWEGLNDKERAILERRGVSPPVEDSEQASFIAESLQAADSPAAQAIGSALADTVADELSRVMVRIQSPMAGGFLPQLQRSSLHAPTDHRARAHGWQGSAQLLSQLPVAWVAAADMPEPVASWLVEARRCLARARELLEHSAELILEPGDAAGAEVRITKPFKQAVGTMHEFTRTVTRTARVLSLRGSLVLLEAMPEGGPPPIWWSLRTGAPVSAHSHTRTFGHSEIEHWRLNEDDARELEQLSERLRGPALGPFKLSPLPGSES